MTDENLKALEEKARAALDLEGTALDLAEGVLALLERVSHLQRWQDEAVRRYEKGDRYAADHVWAEKHRREVEEP